MTVSPSYFTTKISQIALQWAWYSSRNVELTAIANGLGTDPTVHDCTVETPPSATKIGNLQTTFTNDVLLVVNKGKGGNLSNATMASIINQVVAGPAPPFYFPTGSTAIFSTRLIVSGYAGKAFTVRRDSDNTTLDIGFTAVGDCDATALLTFIAGTTGFVTRWYDQSGNGNNVSQATTYLQPQVVVIGSRVWLAFGGLYYIGSQGTPIQYLSTATNFSLSNNTVGVVCMTGSDISQIPLASLNGTNGFGWYLAANGSGSGQPTGVGSHPKQAAYFAGTELDGGALMAATPGRITGTSNAGAATLYFNGASVATASATVGAANKPIQIGGWTDGTNPFAFEGLLGEVWVYPSALSGANLSAIDANQGSYWGNLGFQTPYSGAAHIHFGSNETITLGNILQYERTQPWTAFAAVQMYAYGYSVIFSNVPSGGPAYPGYEFWVGPEGKLRVRIIHDIGANQYLGAIGSTVLVDGRKHFVAASYDGSSTIAGVKLYVDGVPETVTTESNTLAATIIAAGQNFLVGNQTGTNSFGAGSFGFRGTLGHVQLDNVVRSPSYIAACAIPSSLPTVDINTVLCLALTAGSGTTAIDSSSGGHNGTLASGTMWVP